MLSANPRPPADGPLPAAPWSRPAPTPAAATAPGDAARSAPRAAPGGEASPQALLPALQARWGDLPRIAMRDQQVELATALATSSPVALAVDLLTVEFAGTFSERYSTAPELQRTLEGLVELLAGRRLRVAARRPGGSGADERGRRYQAAQGNPLVKALLSRFGADIVAREMIARDDWLQRLNAPPVRPGDSATNAPE